MSLKTIPSKRTSARSLTIALLPVLLTCCAGPELVKQNAASPDEPPVVADCSLTMRGVVISRARRSLRLDTLDRKAQVFIRSRDKSFPPAGTTSLRVSVDTDHASRIVTLDYDQGVGKRCWRVTFDSQGAIQGLDTAVMQFD